VGVWMCVQLGGWVGGCVWALEQLRFVCVGGGGEGGGKYVGVVGWVVGFVDVGVRACGCVLVYGCPHVCVRDPRTCVYMAARQS